MEADPGGVDKVPQHTLVLCRHSSMFYDGSWQVRTASGGRVHVQGTRPTSHGIGIIVVPNCSVVTIQQCVEAWTFSDELRALRDAPAVLANYLLADQSAVASVPGQTPLLRRTLAPLWTAHPTKV